MCNYTLLSVFVPAFTFREELFMHCDNYVLGKFIGYILSWLLLVDFDLTYQKLDIATGA